MDLEYAISSSFSLEETELERAVRDAARGVGRRWLSAEPGGDPQRPLAAIAELGLGDPQSADDPEFAKLAVLAFVELGAVDLGRAADLARHLSGDGQSGPAQRYAVQIVCAVLVGAMHAAVAHAFAYAAERKAFGKPILNHQAVALRLADMVIAAESAVLLLHSSLAAGRAAAGSDLIVLAAQVDAASRLVFRDAVQVAAAHGYVASSRTACWFEAAGPITAFLRELARPLQDGADLCHPSLEPSHEH